jgi:hypothetical protein
VVQKKDINTINPKGNYTQSERVQPIHIYIYKSTLYIYISNRIELDSIYIYRVICGLIMANISPIPSAQLAGSGDGELLGLEAQSLQARGPWAVMVKRWGISRCFETPKNRV